jgi:diguanylate cyclase
MSALRPDVPCDVELRRAVDDEQFRLHFQPIVDMSSGSVRGVEALLRWQHPDRGLLSPAAFLPALEMSSLMPEVTAIVLRLACRGLAESGQSEWTVSVNIAVADAVRRRLPKDVRQALRLARLPADRLILEVTETGLLTEHAVAARILAEVRDAGVGISLDDFGTGYSSLHYMRELPVTELKVDGLFVAEVESNLRDARIVNILVRLAEAFEVDVVAEGVERQSQASFLRQIGCTFAQGYLWGRPAPLGEILAEPPRVETKEAPLTMLVAERVRQLASRGVSPTSIAAALNREGLTTPQGRRWHQATVARQIATMAASSAPL